MHVPPPLVAVAAAVAQGAFTGPTTRPNPGRAAVAAAIGLASGSMAGGAARHFRRSDTTVDPVHPDRASVLVTSGPNSISRNPMYVGLAGLLVANAVWRGSWVGLLPVVAFGAFIDRTQIRAEEAALLDKFGAEYDAYRASTPRWIGLSSPASSVS
jgi:protein-S-isoprenylcysteine O-methyltransferase Ste14